MSLSTFLWSTVVCLTGLGAGHGDDDDVPPPRVVVRCHPDASIRGTEVQLRDLATVETDDPELTARLLQAGFGTRPAPGYARVLTRQDILLRLTREGLSMARLKITGADRIALRPAVTHVTTEQQAEVAESVLRGALREIEAQGDVEIELATGLHTLAVPPGRYSMDVTGRLSGPLSHSAAAVELQVRVDDEAYRVVRVPFRIRRYQQILVANRAIKKGEPLGLENLMMKRIESSVGASPWLTDLREVAGKVASNDLRQGQRMTLSSASSPAVIHRGDIVHLVSSSGRIRVTTRALALSDGAVDQRIQVRNLTANRVVQAVVHGQGLVVVPNAAVGRRR
ncbi:MAG: flagellar basal body P-ring formation chaperone FlgA [Planctomycetota bacterium]